METGNVACRSFEAAVFEGISRCFTGHKSRHKPRRKPVLLAALSGGADSTAMTAALAALRETAPLPGKGAFTLHCFHVNHGIRPPESSDADEAASTELCKKLGIPFAVTRILPGAIEAYSKEHGTGMEGAARHFRHAALNEEAHRLGAGAILIAHTADDRLENIFMAFLRGSGPAGLGATPPDNKLIVRPLLSLARSDVLAYLKERGLSYCTDETNADERFFRNRIRLRLIPFLDQHFPGWKEPVQRLGDTQAMTADFIREEAARRLSWEEEKAGPQSPRVFSISSETFFSQPEILREEALFGAIDDLACGKEEGKTLKRKTIRAFIRGGQTAADLGMGRLLHKNGRVMVQKAVKNRSNAGFSVLIKSPGIYKLKGITVHVAMQSGSVDEGAGFFARFPLALHSSAGGTIFAEDSQGRAAVIGLQGLVRKQKQKDGLFFKIELNGGANALGSE
jgi:tRNA(Ile)-lysidine synthase